MIAGACGKRRSPLAHRVAVTSAQGAARVEEVAFCGLVILRGERSVIAGPVANAIGVTLPGSVGETGTPGETGAPGEPGAMWLSPDEWLIVTQPGGEADILGALTTALGGIHHNATDVTDYYTTIRVSGSAAREMLMKLTDHDLHPRSFTPGMFVAMIAGHAAAWLHRHDGGSGDPAYDIFVRRSMADYLWCLIAAAGREYGLPAQKTIGRVKLHLPHFERD